MQYTTGDEDRIADKCRSFGGASEDMVAIAERLDTELDEEKTKTHQLEQRISELEG